MRVLLIEDDDLIACGIQEGLVPHGFITHLASSASEAEARFVDNVYDAIVLDLGLPDRDGFDLLSVLRRMDGEVPVLILSARDGVDHRISGLQKGADDYLVKPFDMRELSARLHALIRRVAGRGVHEIIAGPLKVEPESGLAWIHGAPVSLSRKEVDLISHLANGRGRWTSVESLNRKLYGLSEDVGKNAMNVHIYNIRRKLGAESIESSRGLGYRLGWGIGQ
ncbi:MULTISPECIES: response regulator [Stenotrophomonas]|uniref:Response regulator n=1 Tax=Stenotrophomonas lactitubi TaxID=2045214 RepID=A0AAW4GIJ0_9GAMM|nr:MULTISPECIES: response regulator [Stenotrophomonas]MBM9914547.1 response regulator [Stenotrophomonas lactitubi]MBM9922832.1 response regulator [Stenotrophomonas lactitubi]MBM9938676.1 response regulator [Stenotrophomonas lactitubi]